MVPGVEVAVGFVFAWLVRKAKRVGDRADGEVDRGLDAAMERLHDLVSRRLGQDPALERAGEEAAEGRDELSERTRRRLMDLLEDAAERDPGFGRALADLVEELQAARAAGGGVSATGHGIAIAGNVDIRADNGSAAALTMGSVTIGAPVDPPPPGPARG
ncbi:hypothetical protein [Streptomyces flaveolus]|uniref:hypothetical protein n=1 Tax=Streptomyces flaveolus TaxID=67297 RepID=UPI0036F8E147